jgi:hypothetical protein
VRFCIIKNGPQLFSTRCFHTLVGETPTHGSQNARDNSHDKTNEYRVKPSRSVGYSWGKEQLGETLAVKQNCDAAMSIAGQAP